MHGELSLTTNIGVNALIVPASGGLPCHSAAAFQGRSRVSMWQVDANRGVRLDIVRASSWLELITEQFKHREIKLW